VAEREYVITLKANSDSVRTAFKQASEFAAGFGDGFKKGVVESLAKGEHAADQFGDSAKKAASSSLSSFESIALKIGGVVGALDLAGKAMSAIGGAIEGVFAGISRGGEFDDLSKRIGVSVETLSSLELGARTSGVSIEGLGTGIQMLSRNMVEAATGSKEAQAGFASLGIAVTDANGRLKSSEEILLQIADQFAGAEDGAAKTAIAMQLLGRSGAQLIPFLNEGADGLRKWQELSAKLGLNLTGELTSAMDSIGDSTGVFMAAVEGVQNQLAIGMAPALAAAGTELVELVSSLGIGEGGIRAFGEAIGTWVRDALGEASGVVKTFQTEVEQIGFGPALVNALNSAMDAAVSKATEVGANIGSAIVTGLVTEVAATFTTKLAAIIAEGAKFAADQVRFLDDIAAGQGGLDPNELLTPGARSRADQLGLSTSQGIDAFNASVEKAKAAGQPFLKLTDDLGGSFQTLGTKVPPVTSAVDAAGGAASKTALELPKVAGAAKQVADAMAATNTALITSTASMRASTDQILAQTNAILQGVAGGDAFAAILDDAARASLEVEAAQKLAAGATIENVGAWLLEEDAARAAGAAKAAAANTFDNAKQIADLTTEVGIWRQVEAQVISVEEAYRQLAIEKEKSQGASQEQAEQQVDQAKKLGDELDALKDKFGETKDDANDAFEGIDAAFGQTIDGLINGTLEMSDVWQSFTLGLLKDWTETMGGVSGIGAATFDGLKGLFTGDTGSKNADGESISFTERIGGGVARNKDGTVDVGGVASDALGGGATAFSLFQPTDNTQLQGILAKGVEEGVINASNTLGQVIGTVIGAVASIWLGPLGGVIGAAVGSGLASAIASSVDRDTFRSGQYTGFVGVQQSAAGQLIDPNGFFHAWLTDIVLALPTLGLAMRKGAEAILDSSETFAALQVKFGDITVRSGGPQGVSRNNLTGSDTARARGFSDEQIDLTFGATQSLFSQLGSSELNEDAGRLGEAMGNIMAEFLSRGLAEGVEFEAMFDQLRLFAHEAGIDVMTSMRGINDVLEDSVAAGVEFGRLDPSAAAAQGARSYAEALVGVTQLFKGDYPAGVNLTSIALRNMEKDGVNAFGEIDDAAKDTLRNLSDDTALTMDVIEQLVAQGFSIDTEEFERQLASIAASASFIGGNIAAVFTGDSVFSGIEAMGQELRNQINSATIGVATEQLFDKTRIAEAFSPVFEVVTKLQEGDFDLTDTVGLESFRNQMVSAIALGKANLQEYIPQLRAIRDAAAEVDQAIEEALKPTDAEAFWINLEETIRANKDAIEGMAESLFEVAANAEALAPGSGRDAAREQMDSTIDASAFNAAKVAAGDFAAKSPQGDALAQLTTEFQFKVAAAFSDGVISGAEKADLTRLKAKMDEAGQVFADSISSGTAGLSDLFRADRLKEAIDAATSSLRDAVGGASGSMFDVIKGGGSTSEGVAAFGESFRSSVRDNILQGMQEALVQSAVMEGALGTLMGQLKQAVSVALEDGFISADEQAFIDGLAKGIGSATDATLTALGPTLETLGGVAQTVVGNTDKAVDDVKDLNENARNTGGELDEMARRAAKNLEEVGDAVGPDVTGALKDGINTLAVELDGDKAAEIGDGLVALREAFGPDASPEEIGAGLEKIKAALGANGGAEALAVAATDASTALRDGVLSSAEKVALALGATGAAGAADEMAEKLRSGLQPATDEMAEKLRSGLQPATDEAAEALRGNFKSGLDLAEAAARKLAEALGLVPPIPGRANGGPVPAGTMAFVGERGPELILAHEGGGVSVMPLDGVPGFANGTGDLIPIGVGRPGTGAPITSPLDPRHPDYVDPRDKPAAGDDKLDVLVSFNFDNAIEEFANGGSADDLQEALRKSTGEGVLDGMMNALVESIAFEAFNEKLSDATREAMKDGVIDVAEAAELGNMAEEFAGTAETAILAMGPAFDVVAEAFGLKTEEEVVDALTTASATAGNLIGGSLQSALRDPKNLSFDTFSLALRQAVYGNIVEGLVGAFIDAAVIQGALAPMLALITGEFGNLGKAIAAGSAEGIAMAAAGIAIHVGKIADILDDPAFKAAIQSIIDIGTDAAKALGLNLDTTVQNIDRAGQSFDTAADKAANACTGECDLGQKLVTTDEKITQLDAYGRTGGVSDSQWVDTFTPLGRDPAAGATPDPMDIGGNGRFGNPSWTKDKDWRRDRSRARSRDRRNRIEYGGPDDDGWYHDDDAPWKEPPHLAAGGIVTRPTYALIGESGPEAIIPLSRARSGDSGNQDVAKALNRLADSLKNQPLHAEVKMNDEVLIEAWTIAKRVADKAGISFGG